MRSLSTQFQCECLVDPANGSACTGSCALDRTDQAQSHILARKRFIRRTIESKILQRASEKRQLDTLCFLIHHSELLLQSSSSRQIQSLIGSNAKAKMRQTIAVMATQHWKLDGTWRSCREPDRKNAVRSTTWSFRCCYTLQGGLLGRFVFWKGGIETVRRRGANGNVEIS